MRARVLLHHETLGEERLEGRCDEAHRSASKVFSSRAATGAMSSGVEARYQSAEAGFTWPITVESSGRSAPASAPASKCVSSRAATGAMSSGVEVRYQYVDAGFTWPITVESSGRSAPTSAPASCQETRVVTAKRWRKSCSLGRQRGDAATTPARRHSSEKVCRTRA